MTSPINEPAIEEQDQGIDQELFWTKKEPRKSLSTFFRNQNKLMVNMLNMMDRKASMMIRINSTLVSGIVVFFEHISQIKGGKVIGIVVVVFSFISLVSAVFAARPPITKFSKDFRKKIGAKYPRISKNIFMVGLTSNLKLEEYEDSYNELVNSQELQIGNQIRTHYVFESELKKGFKMLEFSYNAFLVGFVLAVVIFLFNQI
ncbi:MAG: Pycsar system effector family protein [Bacteroidota bacterium]|nr:Pycsar system effector family protein [uncultured Allomuricauda sp.]